MTAPVWFTVTADYKSVLQDSASDSNYDGELGPVSATVTFTPILNNGDIILATEASPRPTGFVPTPVVARIDVTDGRLKLRVDPDDGGTGTFAPVRLLANSPLLELDGDLAYRAVFSNVVFGSKPGYLKPVTFLAPATDQEVNLITVTPIPGSPGVGITRGETGASGAQGASGGTGGTGGIGATGQQGIQGPTGPTGASGTAATISVGTVDTGTPGSSVTVTNTGNSTAAVFAFSIPRGDVGASGGTGGVGATGATGLTGASGASGGTGGTGGVGATGEQGIQGPTGPTGSTGPTGASGGTGGTGGTGGVGATGLAGQAANLLGTVANYAALVAISSPADGDAYLINDGAGKIYIYDSVNGWPADGSGIQFVGPVGSTGPAGATGASGIPGQDGATGPQGATGEVGPTGATGPAGATGASGASGGTGGTGGLGATGVAGTTTWSGITDKPAVIAAGVDAAAARNVIDAEYTGNRGAANGYASLDSSGLVPSTQLPGFVDDVIEGANLAAFPATGVAGVMYVALDSNKVYRWGGSTYVEISGSPGSTDAVPEGSTNLYYTNTRADGRITAAVGGTVQAYSATLTTYAGKTAPSGAVVGDTDTQTLTNKTLTAPAISAPTGLVKGDVGLGNVDNTSNATERAATATLTNKTISGANNTVTNLGVAAIGASGTPSSSTFLRGDGSWQAVSSGITRSVQTITVNTTLGAAVNTDYVVFCSPSLDANTASLIHADGSNNSTSVVDDVPGITWSAGGDAKLLTDQKKFGTASLFFDGAGDSVSNAGGHSSLAFSTTDFCLEFWMYPSNVSGTKILYEGSGTVQLYLSGSTLNYYNGTSVVLNGVGTVSANTWQHVALARSGTSLRLFLEGTQIGSTITDSVNYGSGSGFPKFGIGSGSPFPYAGYLDEIRISKTARYTANFTPPTSAFSAGTAANPTLPTAVGGNANQYTIRNISASASVSVPTTSSQTIDGSSTTTLTAGQILRVISDGTNWRTV